MINSLPSLVVITSMTLASAEILGVGAARTDQAVSLSYAAVTTVCTSGCDFTSIQQAVDDALPGDTIALGPGTFYEDVLVDRDLIVRGAGPEYTVVDGGGTGAGRWGVFLIEGAGLTRVTLADMTIRNGDAWHLGGGVSHLDGRLEVENCIIRDNTASADEPVQAYGGGVFSVGNIRLSNSVITGNRVLGWGYGGGVAVSNWWYRSPAPSVEIEDTTITGNYAASFGGGLTLGGGWLDTTLRNSAIVANTACVCAGADLSGFVTISNTTVSNNTTRWGEGDELCPASEIDSASPGETILMVLEPFNALEPFVSSGDLSLGGEHHYTSFVLRRGDTLIVEPHHPLTIVADRIVIDGTIDATGRGHGNGGGTASLIAAEVTITGEILADGSPDTELSLQASRNSSPGNDGGEVFISGLEVVVTGYCSAQGGKGGGGTGGRIEVLYQDRFENRGVFSVAGGQTGNEPWPGNRSAGDGSFHVERYNHLLELMPILRKR